MRFIAALPGFDFHKAYGTNIGSKTPSSAGIRMANQAHVILNNIIILWYTYKCITTTAPCVCVCVVRGNSNWLSPMPIYHINIILVFVYVDFVWHFMCPQQHVTMCRTRIIHRWEQKTWHIYIYIIIYLIMRINVWQLAGICWIIVWKLYQQRRYNNNHYRFWMHMPVCSSIDILLALPFR